MGFLRRLMVFLFIIAFLCILGFYFYIRSNGKAIVEEKLSAAFHKPVHVREVGLSFPLSIRLDNLVVEDGIKASVVDVKLSITSLISRQFVLSYVQLINPEVHIHRTSDMKFHFGNGEGEVVSMEENVPVIPKKMTGIEGKVSSVIRTAQLPAGVYIEFFEVIGGHVSYRDLSSPKEFKAKLSGINLKARALAYPFQSIKTKYKLEAKLESDQIPFSGSHLQSEGWVNVKDRAMDANVYIVKASGKHALTAGLKGTNNDLIVKGSMNLNSLQTAVKTQEEEDLSTGDFVLNALKASGIDVEVNFEFKTKMDSFKIEPVALTGSINRDDTKSTVSEGLRKIGEQFEAFGKKFYAEKVKKLEEEMPQNETVPRIEEEVAP